jgi:hypothetical protein
LSFCRLSSDARHDCPDGLGWWLPGTREQATVTSPGFESGTDRTSQSVPPDEPEPPESASLPMLPRRGQRHRLEALAFQSCLACHGVAPAPLHADSRCTRRRKRLHSEEAQACASAERTRAHLASVRRANGRVMLAAASRSRPRHACGRVTLAAASRSRPPSAGGRLAIRPRRSGRGLSSRDRKQGPAAAEQRREGPP